MRRWWQGFGNRHPLFMAAMVAAGCVAAADGDLWRGFAAGLLLGGAGWVFSGWKKGLAWLLCGLVSVTVFAWRDGQRKEAERGLLSLPSMETTAILSGDAKGTERFWMAPARLESGPGKGCGVWWEGRGALPVAGARITAKGNFGPLPEPRNPGEFNRADWLRRQGLAAVFHAGWKEGKVETGKLALLGAEIRRGFRDAVTAGLDEESEEARVIRAVVIGESPPDSELLVAAFRNSGTLHVFSVSGLHVAMVGSIGWIVLGWAGVPRRWAVVALLPLIFGYSWITGNSAPAVRSAWMAAVFLGAFVFRRKPDLLNALGAVLLGATLWDGRLLFQPGVQLSYGVVAAIAVGTAWAARTFAWMAQPELYLPERMMSRWQTWWLALRRNTAQSLSVSLAAGVGSAPLTVYHFGLLTPVSVLAGLVLVPLVYVLLVASLLAVAVAPVPPVSRFVNRMNGYVAKACVYSAQGFSSIPGGHWQVGRETRPMLLAYDLEYGSGAACFSGGYTGAVLMDCGDPQTFRRVVAPSLRKIGLEPDAVVLSHPDGNHLGGGSQVWEMLPIRQALLPVKQARSPAFRAWLNDAPKAGIRIHQVSEQPSFAFPDSAVLEVIHVPDPFAKNALADERVAVFRLHWRGWKILLTSDAGMGSENKILDSGKDIAADVIIAGRHRSDITLGDRFLNAVAPRAIIASNSLFPVEERLPKNAAAYWKSRGIEVFDQAETGGVTLRIEEDGSLRISGFLGQETVLKR